MQESEKSSLYVIDFSTVYITRDSSQTKNSDFLSFLFFRWSYGIVLHEIFTLGNWNFSRFLGDLRLFGLGVRIVRWQRKPEENTIST